MRSERLQARWLKEIAANRSTSPPSDDHTPSSGGSSAKLVVVKSTRQHKHSSHSVAPGGGGCNSSKTSSKSSSQSGWESSSQSQSPDSEKSQGALSVPPSSSHSPTHSTTATSSIVIPVSNSKEEVQTTGTIPTIPVNAVQLGPPSLLSASLPRTAGSKPLTNTNTVDPSSKSHVYLRARSTLQKLREVELDDDADHQAAPGKPSSAASRRDKAR